MSILAMFLKPIQKFDSWKALKCKQSAHYRNVECMVLLIDGQGYAFPRWVVSQLAGIIAHGVSDMG